MNEKNMYRCEKCSFSTTSKSLYDRHLICKKHINGFITRNRPSKDPFICCICNNYKTKNTFNLKTHILNNHSTSDEKAEKYTYFCNLCNFGTYKKDSIDKHIKSKKHIKRNEESFVNPFED